MTHTPPAPLESPILWDGSPAWQFKFCLRVAALNGFEYHISAVVGKTKTRLQNQPWSYIIWRYERDVKITLKKFIFPSLPLSFSPSFFFSWDRFMSRQATCVLFTPIRQSWWHKDLIIWKVWKAIVSENAAVGLLYKYVCKHKVRIKDVTKCHELQLDLLYADAFSEISPKS